MSRKWNPYTKWWLLWGLAFLGIELTAVKNRDKTAGGSLSSLVWRFTDPQNRVRRLIFLSGWLALSSHFIFHWPDF